MKNGPKISVLPVMLRRKAGLHVTNLDQLQREIYAVRESIRVQRSELADIQISEADHYAARAAILSLIQELEALIEMLDCLLDQKRDQERPNAERP
jgi:hypothetical protein